MAIFTGAGVAIVTPFHADGTVNFEKFAEMIEYQILNKTDAIIVCGTTGEASTLSHEEHLECIRFCVETVAGRVPVIAGTGSNCTETAVYLSKEAEKYGLGVNAGHDLSLENLKYFSDQIPNLLEVSIGHALISEALYMGLENTVQAYLKRLAKC